MRKIMLLGIFIANFAFAGVEVQNGKISADVTGQPLRQVLQTLKQNTNIKFSIDDEIDGQTISARFQDLSIAAGIKKMLEGTGINYVVMADAAGQPTSIFIGKSEKPGTPPKKLDTRPVTNMPNRGVVQPIQPVQQAQPLPQNGNRGKSGNRQPQENKPAGMQNTVEVPTAGSFVAPTPQIQPLVNPNTENRANPDDQQNDEDEDEDE